jgi:hypothetical protein
MPDKIVVDVFNDMRALSRELDTNDDERFLTESFFLANEGIHANQWVFVLGALVPASQDIHPRATVNLRLQLLNGSIGNLFARIPVSTDPRLPPEYQQQHERAGQAKSKAYSVAQKFLKDFFSAIQKNLCSGTAVGKELTIQSAGAGLAATIAMELSVSQPFAIAITTAVLVVVMKSGKDAFCKMDFEQFWQQVDANTPEPKSTQRVSTTGAKIPMGRSSRPRTPRK